MPLKTQSVEEPTLNLTPMIDVVFLLIIFFMVGARFSEEERQYDVKLPTVSEARPLSSLPDEITINIRADGTISVKGETITLEKLKSVLGEAKKNYADQAVIIRGDASGPYQHVMDVMSACNETGITSVSLANKLKSGEAR